MFFSKSIRDQADFRADDTEAPEMQDRKPGTAQRIQDGRGEKERRPLLIYNGLINGQCRKKRRRATVPVLCGFPLVPHQQ
ncbi:hypothetical protein KL86DPRO_50036 [uncultured delta proteobacterium]|uniref:Uncharacterized protein n=1 Tax=uncultured delta proteobacterium TaxID=34034 RepID=A0A212KBA6_9DELT|nr:hypothetical protein KL86DPRO_50036 [uncultured delta proteobacterium]